MGNKELISVVTPVFNVKEFLPECLDSILIQTYSNFELIVVDDGSTDGSSAICDEYSSKDPRITVIHKENGGLSEARNLGISKAKGSYICLVDSDDIVAPVYLQVLYDTLKSSEADIVACNYVTFINKSSIPKDISSGMCKKLIITEKEMGDENFAAEYTVKLVTAFNKIYKRSVFDKIRYPVGKIHEDAYVYHRILHEVKQIIYISDVLYYYRIRKHSITNSKFNLKELEDSMGAVIDRIDYYNELGMQQLVNVALEGYLYFFWRNIGIMKKEGITDYKELIKPYIKVLRKKIRLLKVSKEYSFIKIIKMYYIAYLKKDF